MVFIYTKCENMAEANLLAEIIISRKIAACVDFWEISSRYNWNDLISSVSRVMIMITTFESKLDIVNKIISENHNYSVPLIAGVDVRRINHPYKEWMSLEIL